MTTESDAAALRLAFNRAAETYPRHIPMSSEVQAWWAQFYSAIRDTQAGLAMLAESQQLRERLASLDSFMSQIRKANGETADREEACYDRGFNDCLDDIRQHLGMAPLSCACGDELKPGEADCVNCRFAREGRE